MRSCGAMAKQVLKLADGGISPTEVWSDYLAMHALAIANSVPIYDDVWTAREKEYTAIAAKYDKAHVDGFAELAAFVTDALDAAARDKHFEDILGEAHMELAANLHLAQVFTPQHIANMMAETATQNLAETVREQGRVTVYDPAVGGGACLIGFINAAQKRGVDWQRRATFFGQDLDLRCVHQAYIQLSLYGCQATIKCGDTLAHPATPREFFSRAADIWQSPTLMVPWAFGMTRAIDAKPLNSSTDGIPDCALPARNGLPSVEPCRNPAAEQVNPQAVEDGEGAAAPNTVPAQPGTTANAATATPRPESADGKPRTAEADEPLTGLHEPERGTAPVPTRPRPCPTDSTLTRTAVTARRDAQMTFDFEVRNEEKN